MIEAKTQGKGEYILALGVASPWGGRGEVEGCGRRGILGPGPALMSSKPTSPSL